ncbi:MAG TPA: LamG-like jellyroll fold domain-containing protein, partial [Polyangia bacterium]
MLLPKCRVPWGALFVTVLGLGALAPRDARAAVCGGATTACGSSTSVTYNGVSMTLYGSATNGTVRSEIWYLKAPASGAHNVVVTATDAVAVTATSMSFTGVDQTTPLGTLASAIGTSATPSVSVTSALGEPIYDVLGAVGSTTPTVTGNQTVRRTNNTSTGISPVVIGSSTAAGQATPVTMSWSIPSADWALAAVPIKASTALTAVGIDSFTATWRADSVLLQWQGGYEPKSAGFFVYRSDGGGARVQLNTDLIPGDALSGKSSSYAWADDTTGWNGPVSYWLKDVNLDGSFKWYGPASPIAVGDSTPAQAPVPTIQGADGGAATAWKAKGEADDSMGGCALVDHSRGRTGLQIVLLLGMIASAHRRKHRLIVAALFFAGAVATNLGLPRPAAAAGGVSVDATATGTGASGLTFAHTMGAGSNGLIVVGVVVPVICQTTATDSGNCGGCGTTCPLSIASSIDSGLLGLWHLNEGSGATSADGTSNNNNATLTGSPAWVEGYSGNALQFNGTSSYAEAPIGTWFGANNTLSVSAWVYATSTTNGPIVGVTNSSPPGGWNMPFLSIIGSTVYGWIYNNTAVSATVSLNAWHMVSLTYDPAGSPTTRFYVDGTQAATATGTYSNSGVSDYWSTYIPGSKPGPVNAMNSYLDGIVDEVRAYNRVLSAGEVSSLYTARLACSGSTCAACPAGQVACSGSCVTTATDGNNCGGCGITCNTSFGESCIASVCNCASGTDCSTFCVDTTTDANNCGGCAVACGAPTPTGVDSGLLAHWPLSDGMGSTTADTSGNVRTATLTGSPTWTTSGYVGDALTFNGTSSYAEGPIGTWFGSNNTLSVSAWVYATSTTNGPIFGVTQSSPPGNWNIPFLSIIGSTVYGGLWNGASITSVSAAVSLNAWHHLALTYDPSGSGTEKFYVDGVLSAMATVTYSPSGVTDYWSTYIPGAKPGPAGTMNSYLKGTIDELRAYSRVLSASEIQLIYYARQTCSGSACGGCQHSEVLCSAICTDTTIDSSN